MIPCDRHHLDVEPAALRQEGEPLARGAEEALPAGQPVVQPHRAPKARRIGNRRADLELPYVVRAERDDPGVTRGPVDLVGRPVPGARRPRDAAAYEMNTSIETTAGTTRIAKQEGARRTSGAGFYQSLSLSSRCWRVCTSKSAGSEVQGLPSGIRPVRGPAASAPVEWHGALETPLRRPRPNASTRRPSPPALAGQRDQIAEGGRRIQSCSW